MVRPNMIVYYKVRCHDDSMFNYIDRVAGNGLQKIFLRCGYYYFTFIKGKIMWVEMLENYDDEILGNFFKIRETYQVDDETGEIWMEIGRAKDVTKDMEIENINIQKTFDRHKSLHKKWEKELQNDDLFND